VGEILRTESRHPEIPGPHFDFALAGAVTSRVRLAMATTIAELENRRGTWLYAATDSLLMAATLHNEPEFIPCPGGPYREGRTRGILAIPIVDVEDALAASGAPWKKEAGFEQEMTAYVSGVYRFALVDPTGVAPPVATEAALGGMYSDPTGTNERTADGHYAWAINGHVAVAAAGIAWGGKGPVPDLVLPGWDDIAVTRPGVAVTWDQVRRLQPAFPERRIRPGTPYLQAVLDRRRSPGVVAITLDVHLPPERILDGEWRNPQTASRVRLTTSRTPPLGIKRVITYRELVELWRIPRDASTAPVEVVDHILTPGVRRTLPVRSRAELFEIAGKEGDDLHALLVDPGAVKGDELTLYRRPDVLAPLSAKAAAVGRDGLVGAGMRPRTASRILKGGRPSTENAALIEDGVEVIGLPQICELPDCNRVVTGRKRFCTDRHRKAASRARAQYALFRG
jgi:hypothetical protein